MADNTKIEWTDATWNPITGCSIVSPGCTNCYAMKLAGTRMKHHPSRAGLTNPSKSGPVWNGQVRFNEQWLTQPLQWSKPRMIFVCAHGDLFAEGVPDEWIDKIFAVMALAPQHTFQVLTKRPERMRDYLQNMEDCYHGNSSLFADRWGVAAADAAASPCAASTIEDRPFPLPNVWIGVSVEDQPRADERILILLDTPAAIRWISAEPLLADIRLSGVSDDKQHTWDYLSGFKGKMHRDGPSFDEINHLDWVVAGGESGANGRPMHPDWARSLRDQCAAAGVPFLFKQWGEWSPVPWKLERLEGESDQSYKDRSETECSQFAVSRTGYIHEMDHKPWGIGRVLPQPDSHHAVKRLGKKSSGRLLDGVEHNGFPARRAA